MRCIYNNQEKLVDSIVAGQFDKRLNGIKNAKKNTNPFLIILGFHRPHYSLSYPKWAIDTIDDYDLNIQNLFIKNNGNTRVNPNINDIPKFSYAVSSLTNSKEWSLDQIKMHKEAYLAAIHWVDYNIGRVMDSLKTHGFDQNTAIIFTSDHGLSVGEHSATGKSTVFEHVSKVPFIINVPWLNTDENKNIEYRKSNALIELLDIFPTITNLVNIDEDLIKISGTVNKVELTGKNINPLIEYLYNKPQTIKNINFSLKNYAITETPRCTGKTPAFKDVNPGSVYTGRWTACAKMDRYPGNRVDMMGISIRTKYFRYTEWRKTVPKQYGYEVSWSSESLWGRELYDHTLDNGLSKLDLSEFEKQNLAPCNSCKPRKASISKKQRRRLLLFNHNNNNKNYTRRSLNNNNNGDNYYPYKPFEKLENDIENTNYYPPELDKLNNNYAKIVLKLSIYLRSILRDKKPLCNGRGLLIFNENDNNIHGKKCDCITGWKGDECQLQDLNFLENVDHNDNDITSTNNPTINNNNEIPTVSPTIKINTNPTYSKINTNVVCRTIKKQKNCNNQSQCDWRKSCKFKCDFYENKKSCVNSKCFWNKDTNTCFK